MNKPCIFLLKIFKLFKKFYLCKVFLLKVINIFKIMRIAIPSDDSINICGHFGKTKGFRILTMENCGKLLCDEYRFNNITGHAQGHHKEENHGNHDHGNILEALINCQIVIAGGMGKRLHDDLKNAGLKVFITEKTSIDQAIDAFINNVLDHNESKCCNHNH